MYAQVSDNSATNAPGTRFTASCDGGSRPKYLARSDA